MSGVRRSTFFRLGFVMALGALSLAPTPGDVGGCGQHPENLDGPTFFEKKRELDCQRCTECGFTTHYCADACTADKPLPEFPEGCVPLVHDGEVCLNALEAASCKDYEDYTNDTGRLSPSECLFCPELTP